jgi:hypothetical protein
VVQRQHTNRVSTSAHLDGTKSFSRSVAVRIEHCAAAHAKGAEPVKNRLFESGACSEFWIDVKRIVVTAESVDLSLVARDVDMHDLVGRAERRLDHVRVRDASVLEAFGPNEERT